MNIHPCNVLVLNIYYSLFFINMTDALPFLHGGSDRTEPTLLSEARG